MSNNKFIVVVFLNKSGLFGKISKYSACGGCFQISEAVSMLAMEKQNVASGDTC